ncbi:hypothetical protein SPBRAN_1640 [uncultured Candidatus Thioglobus sp.]|nr:hypothetical protein SPBRAN_1640 [uncultured Candidatus Thioglobus sp.]
MQVRINTPINTSINTYANVINQTLLNSTNLVSSEVKPSTKKQVAGIASGSMHGVDYNYSTDYTYDINGNILNKSDVGDYNYNDAYSNRPHTRRVAL